VGILGCVYKEDNVAPTIHAALKRLEYRGYDWVGVATVQGSRLYITKDQEKIDQVHNSHNLDSLAGS